ncbi:MAG: serine hydrolase [Bacteroidales bacterium]|nr:serine hydrolase [Bacteroidales bacterium]
MKKYFLCLFFCLFSFIMAAQTVRVEKGAKKLKELSTAEINAIFDRVNPQLKVIALQELADNMAQSLNGTILIAIDDKVVARKTYGYARLYQKGKDLNGMALSQLRQSREKADNRLQDKTPYELASVSKQFTAAAILKLVNAGKIKLTDNLSKFYPNNPYSGITIHHLLCHTSGLPEYFDFPEEIWGKEGLITNEQAIQKVFSRREKIYFKPGMRYKYTNTNYLLLADIVAKVSGVKFEKFMEDSIFKPIGMENTFYVTQKNEHKDIFFPRGHLKSGEEVAFEPLDGTFGDKGLYSCPEALMKWKIAFFNEYSVIPKEWVEKASSPQNKLITGAAPSELYGYGFHLEENPYYGKLVYHGGLWHGFHHIMVYRPSDNLLFICLSNYRNRAHVGKSAVILNILDGV